MLISTQHACTIYLIKPCLIHEYVKNIHRQQNLNELLHTLHIKLFSNFRTIVAQKTRGCFNGEIRQRTSNTWRQSLYRTISNQDLLNDLFKQKLHHLITKQRTLSSKKSFCSNSHSRQNFRMHNRR